MENQMPEQQGGEDQIIDQIGELMMQLSPEKQAMIIKKLAEMISGGEEAPQLEQTVSAEGGVNGKPAGY